MEANPMRAGTRLTKATLDNTHQPFSDQILDLHLKGAAVVA
jgi:hypothetical protein